MCGVCHGSRKQACSSHQPLCKLAHVPPPEQALLTLPRLQVLTEGDSFTLAFHDVLDVSCPQQLPCLYCCLSARPLLVPVKCCSFLSSVISVAFFFEHAAAEFSGPPNSLMLTVLVPLLLFMTFELDENL